MLGLQLPVIITIGLTLTRISLSCDWGHRQAWGNFAGQQFRYTTFDLQWPDDGNCCYFSFRFDAHWSQVEYFAIRSLALQI